VHGWHNAGTAIGTKKYKTHNPVVHWHGREPIDSLIAIPGGTDDVICCVA